ncbi:hypothetical protein [Agreia sp.]
MFGTTFSPVAVAAAGRVVPDFVSDPSPTVPIQFSALFQRRSDPLI